MRGTNRSMAMSFFAGTRAGSGEVNAAGVSLGLPVTYLPARMEQGVAKPPKASFTLFHNNGWAPANGEKASGETFKIWAYGARAEQMAKWLSPGRAIDLFTIRHSFDGNHFVNRQPLLDHTGQPIIIKRQADIIQQFIWREEATKWTANEVQMGRRPTNWENPTHPDYEMWRQLLIQKNAQVWDCQSQTFGFARVTLPQGIQINHAYYQQLRQEMATRHGNLATPSQQTQPVQQAPVAPPIQQAQPASVPWGTTAPVNPAPPAGYNQPQQASAPAGYTNPTYPTIPTEYTQNNQMTAQAPVGAPNMTNAAPTPNHRF